MKILLNGIKYHVEADLGAVYNIIDQPKIRLFEEKPLKLIGTFMAEVESSPQKLNR